MSTASSGSPATQARASVPRPSASILVVNARNEVLLVHRNPKAKAFGGVHVFPGGNYDAEQDESIAMTAIRETFEESGLLIASPVHLGHEQSHLSDSLIDEARNSIHSQRMLFRAFLQDNGLIPDVASLLPFTSWVTPKTAPRRFRTQFYVTFLPSASSAGFISGAKQERIPTPDGGQEVISARFIHPNDALSECHARKIALMPAQFYLISTLASVLEGRRNTQEQRERVAQLSRGRFGQMLINPRVEAGSLQDGRTLLTFEGDEMRGGSKGRLHRVHARTKNGIPFETTLLRNFDVFSEIEPHAFGDKSRL